jgi:hypothetical protein
MVDRRVGTPGPAPGDLHGLETFNPVDRGRGSRNPRHMAQELYPPTIVYASGYLGNNLGLLLPGPRFGHWPGTSCVDSQSTSSRFNDLVVDY